MRHDIISDYLTVGTGVIEVTSAKGGKIPQQGMQKGGLTENLIKHPVLTNYNNIQMFKPIDVAASVRGLTL